MKYLILIIGFALLTGCNMKKYCAKRFPPVETSDTLIITDTITKPVYVEIKLPADTITLSDTIYLPDPQEPLNRFIDTLKNVYAEILCGWDEGRLIHELRMREAIISDTVYVELPQETIYITVEKIHEVEVTPWWLKWVLIAFSVALIGALFRR
jgi:hypothetical protein